MYIKIIIIFVFLSLIIPMSSAVGPIPDTSETYPSWSPDGQKILFDSTGVMSEGLFIVNPDGTELQEISLHEWVPSWAPDGTKIILIKNFYIGTDSRNGSIEIALLDINLMNITRLTFNNMEEKNPKYSPDGSQIVFQVNWDGLYVMNSDGSDLKKIVESASDPDWSPDGKKIVFYDLYEFQDSVWIVNPDGTDKRMIYLAKPFSHISSNFRWTPDSRYLLLNNGTNTITKVNISDPTDIEYIYDPVAHWDPEYSPDGRYVTFVSNMDGGNPDLFVARSNGSDLYRLVYDTNPRLQNRTPAYFYKISRPTPPPWPTPEPTPEVTSAAGPADTSEAGRTPSIPGFTALVMVVAMVSLFLIKRR